MGLLDCLCGEKLKKGDLLTAGYGKMERIKNNEGSHCNSVVRLILLDKHLEQHSEIRLF